MAHLKPFESFPERRAQPFGPQFFRRAHGLALPLALAAQTLAHQCYIRIATLR
jgi:hypothetical protein